jgi:succinate dehydrogenase / fumarate reductase flavoprotein subunit
VCRNAPQAVYELEHYGMPFDRNRMAPCISGPSAVTPATSAARRYNAVLCGRSDRHAIVAHVISAQCARATHFLVEWMALDLIRDASGQVLGVTALEIETGDVYILHARAVLFATGGGGRVYAASTNAFINTGDGLGMAARAGIPLEGHGILAIPSHRRGRFGCADHRGRARRGRLSAEQDGERFMDAYAPNMKDLASRDVVSRAMAPRSKRAAASARRRSL